jgi:hypothetical protein
LTCGQAELGAYDAQFPTYFNSYFSFSFLAIFIDEFSSSTRPIDFIGMRQCG